METNLTEYLKQESGLYLCLENNRTYTNPRTIINLLIKKHTMTLLDYCIKWELVNKENYIQCKICNKYTDSIGKHLSIRHIEYGGITEYKRQYPNSVIISDNYKMYLTNKMKGKNNHNHTTNTTLLERKQKSPFSIESWKIKYPNINTTELEQLLLQFRDNALSNREFTVQIEYYLDRGYTPEESLQLLKERQTTFSKDMCVKKYGDNEGNKIFNNRQEKWLNSLLNNGNLNIGYSNISQELFDNIKKRLPNNNLKYATINNELRLKYNDGRIYLYDFADIDNKKIIEFHGDLFHGNPNKFLENDTPNPFRKNILAKDMWLKDKNKTEVAKNNGYEVLVIWESEYKRKGVENKEEIIKKCIDFILS